MNLYDSFISASKRLTETHLRYRAETLASMLIFRQFTIFTMVAYYSATSPANFKIMCGVAVTNVIAYLLSRTRKFEWAAYMTILEPMIAIPNAVYHDHTNLSAALGSTTILVVGPVLSSLVLPIRQTILVIAGSCISYLVIYLNVDPASKEIVIVQFSAVNSVGCLALLGTWIRDRNERAIQTERAKVLQSSKLASLGEMAGGVAHELNSPLGAIVLSAELADDLLGDIPGSEEARIEVRSIGEVAERMGKIISGLKTFARDAQYENMVSVPAQSWISDSLDLCRQRFFNAGVNVEVLNENLNLNCAVQSIQISQTLVNLLNNSFDAISDKQEKWIRIEGRQTENFLEILVTDSGNGISKDQVEKIFEPFYTTKDYSHGTGLGLSISKGIVKNHGGDLTYDASSKNTRFIIRLPIAAVEMNESLPLIKKQVA